MKKAFSMIISVFLLLNLLSVNVASAGKVDSQSEVILQLKANEEQLKILNSLDRTDMTLYEVIREVFPKEFSKLDRETKIKLSMMRYGEQNNGDGVGIFADLTYGSEITGYGNSLKFWSYNDLSWVSPEMWVESKLIDDDTGDIVEYALEAATYTSYLEAGDIEDPPTGNYRVHGDHWWLYYDSLYNDWLWLHLVSHTRTFSYVNPYE
ncbi:MAG: hypothetical protein HPY66_0818 [Firmicutes bacterium]|nr:hypothetical protein [Bacillota bacterium]MDI6705549.1 hypothetical protein [Bacillota bacterium]